MRKYSMLEDIVVDFSSVGSPNRPACALTTYPS